MAGGDEVLIEIKVASAKLMDASDNFRLWSLVMGDVTRAMPRRWAFENFRFKYQLTVDSGRQMVDYLSEIRRRKRLEDLQNFHPPF